MKTLAIGTTARDMQTAQKLLGRSELVVFPSETVYGLAALADDPLAVAKIYAVKRRPADNPLIVHVQDLRMAAVYAGRIRALERSLMEAFSPGPFTIITERKPDRAQAATAGQPTIALRIPSSRIAQSLIEAVATGIAAPSANLSGNPSPTNSAMAWHEMGGRVAGIIDGPACELGLESTIVRCTDEQVFILRPGSTSQETIQAFLVSEGFSHRVECPAQEVDILVPGRKYRHYAPASRLFLYESVQELQALMDRLTNKPVWLILPGRHFYTQRKGPMALLQELHELTVQKNTTILEVETVEDYSRSVYRLFHQVDMVGAGRGQILAYFPIATFGTEALRDRLSRAAG